LTGPPPLITLLGWIGFQPLEAVFAVIAVAIVILAWRVPRAQPGAKPEHD
jgi:hypothetical protein